MDCVIIEGMNSSIFAEDAVLVSIKVLLSTLISCFHQLLYFQPSDNSDSSNSSDINTLFSSKRLAWKLKSANHSSFEKLFVYLLDHNACYIHLAFYFSNSTDCNAIVILASNAQTSKSTVELERVTSCCLLCTVLQCYKMLSVVVSSG